MPSLFRKTIASLIITSLVLSLCFGVFALKPKEAKAIPTFEMSPAQLLITIKEWVVDAVPKVIAGMVKQYIYKQMIRWAQGGYTDANEPFAITNWEDFLLGAVAMGSAKYIAEFKRAEIDPVLRPTLEFLGLGTVTPYLPTYAQYARPTLQNDLGINYQAFVNSGYALRTGGWGGWFSLLKPENNIYGQIMMAEQARKKFEEDAKLAAIQEGQAGGGYQDEKECITDAGVEECKQSCYNNASGQTSAEVDQCLEGCANQANGICLEYRTKNLGSLIHSSMESIVKADMDWLISADEITELVGLFFSGLFNRIRGQGIAQSPGSVIKSQLQQYQYSYHTVFKKTQTPEEKKGIRVDVLSAILNSIKQLGTTKSCDKDNQPKGDVLSEAVTSILEGEVQHLYVGMEGVNLQPDFEILDPLWGPFKYYGYAWSDVPYNKYPTKCQSITVDFGSRVTCGSISSGLEPTDPNCKCIFDDNAMMCPPSPYPPTFDPTHGSYPQSLISQKESFYNSCKDQYNQVQRQCQNCLDNAKQCEGKTGQEKTDCLTIACSNYTKVDGADGGEDFYNKCLIEEQKQSCFTCLKEYFVPANYCEQVYDYINRSFVKYPAVVYEDLWWGWHDTATCSDNRSSGKVPVGLICRILPDFKYNGVKVCDQYCLNDLTPEEKEEKLEDVYDFSPSDADCQNREIGKAYHPGSQYGNYLVQKRTKCCAALNAHRPVEYGICIGEGTPEEPEKGQDATVCHTNCDPSILGSCKTPDEGEKGWAALSNMSLDLETSQQADYAGLIHRSQAYESCVILRSLREPFRGATYYITKPYCDTVRLFKGDDLAFYDVNGDNQFSDTVVDAPKFEGEFMSYCQDSSGNWKNHQESDIICKFDIDKAPLDPITGKPYQVCCGLSDYSPPKKYNLNNVDDREAICNQLDIAGTCGKREICNTLGIPWETCQDKKYAWTGGLWEVIRAEDGKGAGALCVCETPGDGCGQKCEEGGCQ